MQKLKRKAPQATPNADRNSSMPIRSVFGEWLRYSRAVYRPNSADQFRLTVAEYLEAVGNHPISQWGPPQIDKFLEALSVRRKRQLGWAARAMGREFGPAYTLSVNSKNSRLVALRNFQKWASIRPSMDSPYIMRPFPIPLLKRKRTAPQAPEDSDVIAMIAGCRRLKDTSRHFFARRGWLCLERGILTLIATGARCGELTQLLRSDFDLERGTLTLTPRGAAAFKGDHFRIVRLAPSFVRYVRSEMARTKGEVYWLDSGYGKPRYTYPQTFSDAMGRLRTELGLSKRWRQVHGFRAKFATDMWAAGVDIVTIQAQLGHHQIGTTLGYLSLSERQLGVAAKVSEQRYADLFFQALAAKPLRDRQKRRAQ